MKYTKEMLEHVVSISCSVAEVMRKLGLKSSSGNTHGFVTKKIDQFGIDRSHFKYDYKNNPPLSKKHWSSVLIKCDVKLRSNFLRKAMLESGKHYECEKCDIVDTWQGAPIKLQIDHINGDVLDNTPNNVRFLCPNCHSQTDTHSKVKRLQYRPNDDRIKCKCGNASEAGNCLMCHKKDRESHIPSAEELRELVWSKPSVHIAKNFGVSDRTIGKWCTKRNVAKPPPGYWAKIKCYSDANNANEALMVKQLLAE